MIPEHTSISTFKEANEYVKSVFQELVPPAPTYKNFFRSIEELLAEKSKSVQKDAFVGFVVEIEQKDWHVKGGARKVYFEMVFALLRTCDKSDFDAQENASSEAQIILNDVFEKMCEHYRNFGKFEQPSISYIDTDNKTILPAKSETGDMHGSVMMFTIGGYRG